ncbi:hypothetical protein KBD71_04900, partial [Candidatus Woesebacteria bacterium]|nr:hypothetical protein [Candidatus Woesebacteria bacterium]
VGAMMFLFNCVSLVISVLYLYGAVRFLLPQVLRASKQPECTEVRRGSRRGGFVRKDEALKAAVVYALLFFLSIIAIISTLFPALPKMLLSSM